MDWQELLAVAREPGNDNGALAEICRRFTGLVKKAANQNHLWVVRDDALAEGWLAVIRAVRTYDAQTGVPFPGYVDSQVRYAVWNLFKRERRRWQRELLQLGGGQDDETMSGEEWLTALIAADDVEQVVEADWERERLLVALAQLPERQRLVLLRTFLAGSRLTAVAADLGISAQAAHNLRKRGLAGLKMALAGMYPDEGR